MSQALRRAGGAQAAAEAPVELGEDLIDYAAKISLRRDTHSQTGKSCLATLSSQICLGTPEVTSERQRVARKFGRPYRPHLGWIWSTSPVI